MGTQWGISQMMSNSSTEIWSEKNRQNVIEDNIFLQFHGKTAKEIGLQLNNSYLVDFVQKVDTGNVTTIAFNNID